MSPAFSAEMLIRRRLRRLARMLSAARRGEVEGVHQARVATRRLREVLPLVEAGSARKTTRAVRKLTRVLGRVRELDVALRMVDEFERGAGVPREGFPVLRRILLDERRRAKDDLVRHLDRSRLARLERKVLARVRRRDAGDPGTPDDQAAAARRAVRRAARLRGAIDAAGGLYLPDRLHEVRIAVKKLRYALEILRDLTAAGRRQHAQGVRMAANRDVQTLKRAQELLGRMHDLEVLMARIRGVQGSAEASDLRVSASLDRLVRRLETECRRLHGRYVDLREQLVDICDRLRTPRAAPRQAAPAA